MKADPRGALLTQKSSFLSHCGGPLGEPHSRGRRRTASPHWEPAQWGSARRSRRRSSKSCLPASPLVREINGYVQLDRLIVVISNPQMPAALVRHKDSLLTSKSSRGCTGALLHAVCQGPNVHQSTALDSSASQLRWMKRVRGLRGSFWIRLGSGTQQCAHVPRAKGFTLGSLCLATGEGRLSPGMHT